MQVGCIARVVVSYSISINPIVTSVTVFEIFDIKAIGLDCRLELWALTSASRAISAVAELLVLFVHISV